MLTAAGSPLVGGGHQPDNAMTVKTLRVKVLRAFLIKTVPQKVGAELELDRALAMELASANKVEILRPDIAAAAAVADMKGGAVGKEVKKPKEA